MPRLMTRACALAAACFMLAPVAAAQTLAAAVLPSGRSVTVGATATAYASVINTGSAAATACQIAPVQQIAATFSYQTTNNATNAPTGTPNTPVGIPAGGTQSFLISFTPTAAFAPTDINFAFTCSNTSGATAISGVNTLLLSASATPVPDVIANAATPSNDGIVHIPNASGTGFFSTAAVNIGAGAPLTVTPVVLGGAQAAAFVCQTDMNTGACFSPPSTSVSTSPPANSPVTFSVFVAGDGSLVAPDFAARRVRLEFRDAGGVLRGSTSVAVCTVGTAGCDLPQYPFVAVSTDVTKNVYPATFTTVTMKPSIDPCAFHADTVFYPSSWNGTRPLPSISGGPLNANLVRHANLKDILAHQTTPHGCTRPNDIAELPRTFARMKAMNIDVVTITQWHWAFIKPDGSFGFTGDTSGALFDADLTAFVQAAHTAGLKVMLSNQIQGFIDAQGACCLPHPTSNAENWNKWLAAFRIFMKERAPFFQTLGVEYWEMGCGSCVYWDSADNSVEAGQIFSAAYQTILAEIAPLYTGKKYIYNPSWISTAPNFRAGIDLIGAGLFWQNFTPAEEAALTVESMKARIQASGAIGGIQNVIAAGKPVMVSVGIQSRGNALSMPGYLEETGCTNSLNGLIIDNTNCLQRQTPTDFALQAIVIEAQLEILAGLNLPAGSVITINDYYQSDVMTTEPTFPNLAYSVRNKPAEAILRHWFAR